MIDTTPNEQAAIKHGSKFAVEYLSELGTFDLNKITHDQFLKMCECVVTGYCEAMQAYNVRQTEFLMGLQK